MILKYKNKPRQSDASFCTSLECWFLHNEVKIDIKCGITISFLIFSEVSNPGIGLSKGTLGFFIRSLIYYE